MTLPSSGIERVEASAWTVPTDASGDGTEADGTLSWDSTTIVLVRLSAGGHTGIGWTYGPPACVDVIRSMLHDEIVGTDPMDVPTLWSRMVAQVRNAGRRGVCGYAISAVDVAAWDLKARLLDVPMHALLGRAQDGAPVYASGGFTSYDDDTLTDQLRGWVAEGMTRVKIKVGGPWVGGPAHDIDRVLLARDVIGPDIELFVDGNGAYTAKEAIRFLGAVDEARVTWVEEPVSSDHLDGLRQVRAAVDADVTAGEYACDEFDVLHLCAAEAVDCLQLDATRCGGYTGWLRGAAIAAAHGLEVSAHCAPHLHAPLVAATPHARHLEWFHDHVRIEAALFPSARTPTGGVLSMTGGGPGLGLEPDDDVLAEWKESGR